jgi:hypothetical protein
VAVPHSDVYHWLVVLYARIIPPRLDSHAIVPTHINYTFNQSTPGRIWINAISVPSQGVSKYGYIMDMQIVRVIKVYVPKGGVLKNEGIQWETRGGTNGKVTAPPNLEKVGRRVLQEACVLAYPPRGAPPVQHPTGVGGNGHAICIVHANPGLVATVFVIGELVPALPIGGKGRDQGKGALVTSNQSGSIQ